MRSIENRGTKDQLYKDDLVDAYLRKYSMLVKQMVIDYKKQAINCYITEMYCRKDEKYTSKYKDLIEQATMTEEKREMLALKDKLMRKNDLKLSKISTSLPFTIKKATQELHQHMKSLLDSNDITMKVLKGVNKERGS